jgi:CHASE2 domain-containing sensor protein
MKYLFHRDTILATLLVFVVMWALSLIPLNTHVLSALHLGAADLDYNDLAYLPYRTAGHTPVEDDIVIVDVADADRAELGQLLQVVQAAGPKVTGLDVIFEGPRADTATDIKLRSLIGDNPTLVTAFTFPRYDAHDEHSDKNTAHSLPTIGHFSNSAHHNGLATFITADTLRTVRYFPPFFNEQGRTDTAFAVSIARLYNPGAFDRLLVRRQRGSFFRSSPVNEWVAYRRPVGGYTVLSMNELLPDSTGRRSANAQMLRGKIVLLGYMGRNRYDIEDRFFTPLNPHIAGKTYPDMPGVVVHANIISMILDGDYIDDAARWIDLLLAFVVCWLHMAVFIRLYLMHHLWYHLRVKMAQLLSAIVFTFLGIMVLHYAHFRFNILATLGAVVLAVDVLYIYEALARWLNMRFNYRTLFSKPHH